MKEKELLKIVVELHDLSNKVYTKIASLDDVPENYKLIQKYVDSQKYLVEAAKQIEKIVKTDNLSDFHSKATIVDIDEDFRNNIISEAEGLILYVTMIFNHHDKMADYSDKMAECIKNIEKFEEEIYAI